jgi:hypothetical protein
MELSLAYAEEGFWFFNARANCWRFFSVGATLVAAGAVPDFKRAKETGHSTRKIPAARAERPANLIAMVLAPQDW